MNSALRYLPLDPKKHQIRDDLAFRHTIVYFQKTYDQDDKHFYDRARTVFTAWPPYPSSSIDLIRARMATAQQNGETDSIWDLQLIKRNYAYRQVPSTLGTFPGARTITLNGHGLHYLKPGTFASNEQLQTLILTNNQISYLETDCFRSLPHLVCLALDGNLLKTLPPLNSLVSLRKLSLASNRLHSLPPLPPLTALDISNNDFTVVPPLTTVPLVSLNVSKNRLLHLPDWLQNLSTLRHLDVSVNHLESVPAYLFEMPFLVRINLNKNHLPCLIKLQVMCKGLLRKKRIWAFGNNRPLPRPPRLRKSLTRILPSS